MSENAYAAVMCAILSIGILRIRDAAFSGDAERCAIEADHIHNLPILLLDFRSELIKFYWDVERPAYLRQIAAHAKKNNREPNLVQFEQEWSQLADMLADRK